MKEIDPKKTKRSHAFDLWIHSSMPMVTIFKTFDITHLIKIAHKRKIKFNSLLCWCIGKVASGMEEFYLLPVGDKLMAYESLSINVIVFNREGGINSCDVPFSLDFEKFDRDYTDLTQKTREECKSFFLEDSMVIGTSAMIQTEIEGIVNQYTGIYNNPYLAWGKYHKGWWRDTLPISFQFHHVQMDGTQACQFLEDLQKEMNHL